MFLPLCSQFQSPFPQLFDIVFVSNQTGIGVCPLSLGHDGSESQSIPFGDDRDEDLNLGPNLWLDMYPLSPSTLFFAS